MPALQQSAGSEAVLLHYVPNVQLSIACSWDGSAVDRDERVELELSREDGDWLLHVDAPYHADPSPELPPGATPRSSRCVAQRHRYAHPQ